MNKLYIFGGFDSNGAISSFQSVALEADTSGVEIIASGFEDVNADGEGPCRRFGHTCTYVKGRLFVAGGSTGSSNYKGHRDGEELQDSIYCLNMESHTLRWEKINFAINDSLSFAGLCRCHSAVNINDNILFSFGGAPNETTNHLHLLDLSDMEMSQSCYSQRIAFATTPTKSICCYVALWHKNGCFWRGSCLTLWERGAW